MSTTDIRALRIEKGLSQDGLAALIPDMTGHQIARIERGTGKTTEEETKKVVAALNKAKKADNSRVGKGRPAGSTSASPAKKAPAKKATAKKAPAKKAAAKKAAPASAVSDLLS